MSWSRSTFGRYSFVHHRLVLRFHLNERCYSNWDRLPADKEIEIRSCPPVGVLPLPALTGLNIAIVHALLMRLMEGSKSICATSGACAELDWFVPDRAVEFLRSVYWPLPPSPGEPITVFSHSLRRLESTIGHGLTWRMNRFAKLSSEFLQFWSVFDFDTIFRPKIDYGQTTRIGVVIRLLNYVSILTLRMMSILWEVEESGLIFKKMATMKILLLRRNQFILKVE